MNETIDLIDSMNSMLDRIGSKELCFRPVYDRGLENASIAICFVNEFHEIDWCWSSVDDFLNVGHKESFWEYAAYSARNFRQFNDSCSDNRWPFYDGIHMFPLYKNDIEFLKIAGSCRSLEEFRIKIDLNCV